MPFSRCDLRLVCSGRALHGMPDCGRDVVSALHLRLSVPATDVDGAIVPGLVETLRVNLRDMSEAAGLLALHGARFVQATEPLSNTDLYALRQLSRRRLKLWWDAIAELPPATDAPRRMALLEPLAQEVLVSEVLSRVAAAWLTACGAVRQQRGVEQFARPIVLDQLQAKYGVLRAWLDGGPPLGASLRLNRLRRITERWSDYLLGHSALGDAAAEFAVEAPRMWEFRDSAPAGDPDVGTHLSLLSLRHSVPDIEILDATRAATHRAILQLLVALLPAAAFHWDGRVKGELARRVTGGYLLNDLCATRGLFEPGWVDVSRARPWNELRF